MGLLRNLWITIRLGLRKVFAARGSGYLCDKCRWDYGDACNRPERPNALSCPDYKRR